MENRTNKLSSAVFHKMQKEGSWLSMMTRNMAIRTVTMLLSEK